MSTCRTRPQLGARTYDTVEESMRFSLIVTVTAPDRDVYTPIRQAFELTLVPPDEPTSDVIILES